MGSYNTPMPLRRYIFNTLTVVSLLLILGAVGLMVDGAMNLREPVSVGEYDLRWNQRSLTIDYSFVIRPNIISEYFDWDVFVLSYSRNMWTRTDSISTPLAVHVVVFAILPAIWFLKWNRRRKLDPTACSSCGYDLTGNESGVCPECGRRLPEGGCGI